MPQGKVLFKGSLLNEEMGCAMLMYLVRNGHMSMEKVHELANASYEVEIRINRGEGFLITLKETSGVPHAAQG